MLRRDEAARAAVRGIILFPSTAALITLSSAKGAAAELPTG